MPQHNSWPKISLNQVAQYMVVMATSSLTDAHNKEEAKMAAWATWTRHSKGSLMACMLIRKLKDMDLEWGIEKASLDNVPIVTESSPVGVDSYEPHDYRGWSFKIDVVARSDVEGDALAT